MAIYKIDTAHSDIAFKIKHLMISSTSGSFKTFDGTLETSDPDLLDAKITFEADIESIDTKNEQRDGHLKAEDFFDAAKYPKMKFVSTGIAKKQDSEYTLTGDLTIRDVTKSVDLDVEFNGDMKDPWGMERKGFEINGKVNRKDFGLVWNAVTEAGGIMLGDDVKLQISVELIKQA